MATRSLATDLSAPAPTGLREEDYRTFCAALESTQRGRDFLAEYARRNRHADTEMLLDSLDRIEVMMKAEGKARDRLQDELRVLLIAVRLARPDINSATALTKAARLADLLDLMETRIDAMVENKDLPPAIEPPPPVQAAVPLSVVPPPHEPELPLPSVTSLQGPVIALVQEPTRVVITPVAPVTAKEELPTQELPPVKQEPPQPVTQELAPHEWAQLEIINRPRPLTSTPAEPYELWDDQVATEPTAPMAVEVAVVPPAPAAVVEPVVTVEAVAVVERVTVIESVAAMPEPAAAHVAAPQAVAETPVPAAPQKWLPDFGGEEQIIHTKPVTAAAFMPEVTFMAPAGRAAKTNAALPSPLAGEGGSREATATREPGEGSNVAVTNDPSPASLTALARHPLPQGEREKEVADSAAQPVPTARTVPPRNDPLAAILALSEAERIALFT